MLKLMCVCVCVCVIAISCYECDIIVITRVRGAAEVSVNKYDITRHGMM